MKRTLIIIALFLFNSTLAFSDEKIKIGISLPLSGGAAGEGEDLRKMIIFANRELAGDRYDLIFEDDQCSDKEAATVARRLVDVEKVKYVLGFACSGAVLSSAPIYELGKVVTIALVTGAPAISEAGEYIFRTTPNLKVAASKIYEHAASRFQSIGLISEESAYCQGLATAFIDEGNVMKRLAIQSISYLPETHDFRSVFLKLREKKVEAIFLNPQTEKGMIELYQQFLDSGWKVPVYAMYYPAFKEFLQRFQGKANGIVFGDLPFIEDAIGEEGMKLYEAYKKSNGTPQSTEFYFVSAIAAFSALHQAITKGSDVRDFLYNHEFKTPVARFRFDKNGDVIGEELTFVLKTIRGGKVESASKFGETLR